MTKRSRLNNDIFFEMQEDGMSLSEERQSKSLKHDSFITFCIQGAFGNVQRRFHRFDTLSHLYDFVRCNYKLLCFQLIIAPIPCESRHRLIPNSKETTFDSLKLNGGRILVVTICNRAI
jgi:hypothetical protein